MKKFVDHSHPLYGNGFFCTTDVLMHIEELERTVDRLLDFYKSPDAIKRHGKYHREFELAINKLGELRNRSPFMVSAPGHRIWLRDPKGSIHGDFPTAAGAWRHACREVFGPGGGRQSWRINELKTLGWAVEVLEEGKENQ